MNSPKVYILGGAQTDFARNWHRQELEISDLLRDSFEKALEQCQLDLLDIQSAHVGNFVGELFCGQGQLGGLLLSLFPELNGIPTSRHEAACASGSMAALGAMREIESGHYDLVAVSGIEMMRNVEGDLAAKHLGAAAWVGHEATEAKYPWVHLFSEVKAFYQEEYGLEEAHLSEISRINFTNAKRNPNSQTRKWDLEDSYFGQDDHLNPVVEGLLRRSDCGRVTDGSATIFLASEAYALKYAHTRGLNLEDIPQIKGWGHRSAPITLEQKLKNKKPGQYTFPHLKYTIDDALRRAQLPDARALDAIESHDCFSISEYTALEHFGLAQPGEAWKVIEEDDISFQGKLPVNPSGGLIGMGHPVGATGVRMLLDAYKQVAQKAGDYQVEGAKNVGTLNIGGSFTTVASFVVGK
ncbi:MAG: acetyl-CoA acetyltransferase [Bacteroidota bacterium]